MSSFLSRHQFCATITVAFMLGVIASPLAGEEVTQPSTSLRYELRRSDLPAFPGAEGGGSRTSGGRGGKVLLVTNLDDSGAGSLRAAIETSGPRIIVFRVAGIITLKTTLAISHPFITIAGQSAPGDGICIRGETTEINTHDVVIRYLRLRRGNLKRRDDGLRGGVPQSVSGSLQATKTSFAKPPRDNRHWTSEPCLPKSTVVTRLAPTNPQLIPTANKEFKMLFESSIDLF